MKKIVILMGVGFVSLFADVTITLQGSDGAKSVEYYKNGKALVDDGELKTILNAKTKQITMINSREKKYATMNMKEMVAMVKGVEQDAKAQMRASGMSDTQIQAVMGTNNATPKPKKIGSSKVAGYSCELYESTMSMYGMSMKSEYCVSKSVEKLIQKEIPQYKELIELTKDQADNPLENKGYIMSSKTAMPFGGGSDTEKVTSVSKKSIPNSLFTLPKGYKKVSLQQLLQ